MINVVALQGVLARPAAERVLPSGTRLLSLEVTVARPDGPADPVPVAWFDAPASAAALDAGIEVVVVGRVRRRFFRGGGLTQSRTEVVASRVVRATESKRAKDMLAAAGSTIEAAAAALAAPAGTTLGPATMGGPGGGRSRSPMRRPVIWRTPPAASTARSQDLDPLARPEIRVARGHPAAPVPGGGRSPDRRRPG